MNDTGVGVCRHNRADIVRDLAWRVGLELLDLPPEIQDKLTTLEKGYFKNHSVAIKSYMGKVGIELNVVSNLDLILLGGGYTTPQE